MFEGVMMDDEWRIGGEGGVWCGVGWCGLWLRVVVGSGVEEWWRVGSLYEGGRWEWKSW